MIKLLLVFLLIAGTAHAQELKNRSLYNASRVTLYSGVAFDLASTEVALRRGYEEGNPLLGQNPYRRIGIASGVTVGVDLLTRWARRQGYGKAATILNFIGGGVHAAAGVRNLQQPRY